MNILTPLPHRALRSPLALAMGLGFVEGLGEVTRHWTLDGPIHLSLLPSASHTLSWVPGRASPSWGGAFGMQLRGASGMQLRRASTLCLLTSRSRFLTPCPRQGFSLELPVSSLICGSTLCTFQIGTCAHCHSPSWHQAEGSSCTLAEPAYIWPEGASTSLMLHSVTSLGQWALAKGWPAFKCTGRA